MLVSLLHDPAKSCYEQHLVAARAPLWPATNQAAYDAVIQGATDPANPTAGELTVARLARDNEPCPVTLAAIQLAQRKMVRDLVPTGALRREKREFVWPACSCLDALLSS